jgi:hypothetical protein
MLNDREERLNKQERQVDNTLKAIEVSKLQAEALKSDLDVKLKDVEQRAQWIKEQREILAKR